uniref:Tc1-like transposase DDE domain-containing protein n=1 Tax=Caenorhabditis japonica TaxID=281687 RepID=A0A8R1DR91_CAEJA
MDRFVYEQILQNVILPFARASPRVRYLFQQDNDPKHTSNHIKNWFATNRVILEESPSQSLDFNPIEHLWEELEIRVFCIRARNSDKKFSQLQAVWPQIPQTVLTNLIQSMPSCYRFSRVRN